MVKLVLYKVCFDVISRMEAIERSQMLRTKAMREKDELREMRKYKFAIIRVRFPDGILLQVTLLFAKVIELDTYRKDNDDICVTSTFHLKIFKITKKYYKNKVTIFFYIS